MRRGLVDPQMVVRGMEDPEMDKTGMMDWEYLATVQTASSAPVPRPTIVNQGVKRSSTW